MSTRNGFRPDIEGLRTIAILAVVLFHVGLTTVSGGFVGVDLFFVLSGFLITNMLLRELETTGRIRLSEFWARRVRRLLPAATAVLIVTGLTSLVLMPTTLRTETATGIVAATLYAANWYFASNSLDYLNAEESPSPVLHFWSLGVEEQFYVLWPLLLLLCFYLARRARISARFAIGSFAAIVWVSSFAASLYFTEAAQPIAFFSSPTRFWQLATGALLAVAAPWILRLRRTVSVSMQSFGMVLLLASIFGLGPIMERGNAYPGMLALIPTFATALLVAGGTRRDDVVTRVERVLFTPAFQWLGGLSYSWYLWHWPVLVFWQRQFESSATQANLVAAEISLALAWVTHKLIENPIRFAGVLRMRPQRSIAIGAILMAFTISTAAVLSMTDASHTEEAAQLGFHPLPTVARQDVARIYADNCTIAYRDVSQPQCIYGDTTASKRMVLLGDSHAASVFSAFDAAARSLGYRLDVRVKLGCTIAEVEQWHFKFNHPFKECSQWRAEQIVDLTSVPPDVIVVVNANNPTPPVFDAQVGQLLDPRSGRLAWIKGYASTLRKFRDSGSQVIVLRDNPRVPGNIADCVAGHMTDPSTCNFPRSFGLPEPAADVVAARAVPGVRKLDLSDAICDQRVCFAVRNNILAWQKGNHYTATFANSLTTKTTDKLRLLLGVTESTDGS